MATPILTQNSAGSVVVYLTLSADGTGATGLTSSDVTADLKKEGAAGFSSFALSGANFTELDNGFYEIDLAAGDTDILGNLYLRIQGGTVNTALSVANVQATPSSSVSTAAPSVSSIFGYLFELDGSPAVNRSVTATVLSSPFVLHNGTNGLAIDTDIVVTKSDSNGYFILNLVVGAVVDIFIPSTGYRRTVSVPGSSTNLFDIS